MKSPLIWEEYHQPRRMKEPGNTIKFNSGLVSSPMLRTKDMVLPRHGTTTHAISGPRSTTTFWLEHACSANPAISQSGRSQTLGL